MFSIKELLRNKPYNYWSTWSILYFEFYIIWIHVKNDGILFESCSLNLVIGSQNENVECFHIIMCINVSIFVEEVKEIMSSMSNVEFWESHVTFKIIFNLLINTNTSQKGKKLLKNTTYYNPWIICKL